MEDEHKNLVAKNKRIEEESKVLDERRKVADDSSQRRAELSSL
jgi:hypothetical protein